MLSANHEPLPRYQILVHTTTLFTAIKSKFKPVLADLTKSPVPPLRKPDSSLPHPDDHPDPADASLPVPDNDPGS